MVRRANAQRFGFLHRGHIALARHLPTQIMTADWHSLANYPALQDMCQRLETLAPVHSLIQAEGMNATPFTNPAAPNPPEGSPI